MFLLDRRYFRYFDWPSFLLMLTITSIGLLFVYSATYQPDKHYSIFFKKQLFGITTGLFIFLLFCINDYRNLSRWGYFIYFSILGLLLFTKLKGAIGMGAKRWINLFLFRFQPSEIAKLFFPAFVTYYFQTEKAIGRYRFKQFFPVLTILGISALFILKQPDLGTALILLFSGFILLWIIGLNKKFFITLFLFLIITAPISWHYLKPYQKKRIAVFFGAGQSTKERYHIEQSKIAIGSGGFWGKGFLQGTQNKLQFLPESRTDFIFSVVCEEWGFAGALLILVLYTIFYLRLFVIIKTMKNFFAQLLAIGLIIHLFLSTFINIGMVIGLLPIVGIPLPFMSYGITHLWISFACMGWFNSIAIRRFYIGE